MTVDPSELASKPLTPTQKAYTDYLVATTGYQADPRSVALAMQLGSDFRTSPEQVEARAARKAERENRSATVEQRRAERREARAAKLEADAAAIRSGDKRGPGRPPKAVAETETFDPSEPAEAVEDEYLPEDDDEPDTDIEVEDDDDDF